MDDSQFFVETIDELRARLGSRTEYALLRAAALLRQLLIDEEPLVHRVNRRWRHKLVFTVASLAYQAERSSSPSRRPLFSWVNPLPSPRERNAQALRFNEFLRLVCFTVAGSQFTVRDLIRYHANVCGGVHRNNVSSAEEKELAAVERLVSIGGAPATAVVWSITEIVLAALEPLTRSSLAVPALTRGHALLARAKAQPTDSALLLDSAIQEYESACRIDSENREGLHSGGNALYERAIRAPADRAVALFERALSKCEQLARSRPRDAVAAANRALVLVELAMRERDGKQRRMRLDEAMRAAALASELDPNGAGPLSTSGKALVLSAQDMPVETRAELLREATQRLVLAVEADPASADAWRSWGVALFQLSRCFTDEADSLLSESVSKLSKAVELAPSNRAYHAAHATALVTLARLRPPEQARELLQKADSAFKNASELSGDDEVLHRWANCCSALARLSEGAVADQLFDRAFALYRQDSEARSDDASVLRDWAEALRSHGAEKRGEDAALILRESCEIYSRAVTLDDTHHASFNNWGLALHDLGTLASDEKVGTELFAEARQKFNLALGIAPGNAAVLRNLGRTLISLASTSSGDVALEFIVHADATLSELVGIAPSWSQGWTTLGSALAEHARMASGDEARDLLLRAIDAFTRAVELDANDPVALTNRAMVQRDASFLVWDVTAPDYLEAAMADCIRVKALRPEDQNARRIVAEVLLQRAKRNTGKEPASLFDVARQAFEELDAERPGSMGYNLACIAALVGAANDAKAWLIRAKAAGALPSRNHIDGDCDLDAIRSEAWFAELVNPRAS